MTGPRAVNELGGPVIPGNRCHVFALCGILIFDSAVNNTLDIIVTFRQYVVYLFLISPFLLPHISLSRLFTV